MACILNIWVAQQQTLTSILAEYYEKTIIVNIEDVKN